MAVYYKFKSAKNFDSISIDGHFISIINLKERIFESKHMQRGTDFDLIITNAQTNEEYLADDLVAKNTSVIVRRVPGLPRKPIVPQPDKLKMVNQIQDDQPEKSILTAADSSGFLDFGASELDDDFGSSIYETIPEMKPLQTNNPVQDPVPPSKADEDDKIKTLVESSGFDWQNQHTGIGPGRGFGKGGQGGRSLGQGSLQWKTPPQGYVCHRCNVPGHYIQHCPTNGDPDYDIKKVRHPTGIPKSMLLPASDGSYTFQSGSVVMKPDEDAFDKTMEGISSSRSLGDFPPELYCSLCKEVMKDAVLSSKCCFASFCDKCIRDYIISNSTCFCGARDVLADDLLPNVTLRDTINRILESGNSSTDNASSVYQAQDMESALYPQPRISSSTTQSAASREEQMAHSDAKESLNLKQKVDCSKPTDVPQKQEQPLTSAEGKIIKVSDVSEVTHESLTEKEPESKSSVQPVEEEVQQKVAAVEAGNKKMKMAPSHVNTADMQWMDMHQGINGICMGPSPVNPCWPGMQPVAEGFLGPFGGNMPYNTGYGPGPLVMPFGHFIPPYYFGAQGFMMPPMLPVPQRDFAEEFDMSKKARPSLMGKEEVKDRKAEVRRKQTMELHKSRDSPRNHDYGREASSNADTPVMSKHKPAPSHRTPSERRYYDLHHDRDYDCKRETKSTSLDHDIHHRTSYTSRSSDHANRELDASRPILKRKYDHHEMDRKRDHHHCSRSESSSSRHQASETAPTLSDGWHKAVTQGCSRVISIPEEELSKKRRRV